MKTIQPNANNFQKRKLTELPITIVTDDEHKTGDNLEMARQRIEKAALYQMSIFNLIKVAALHFEGEAETRELRTFCGDLMNQCEIAYAVNDSILASASCLTEFIPDEKSQPESANVNEEITDTEKYTGDTDIDQIALAISGLLGNEKLPKPLARGFDKVMVDFINDQLDHDEFNEDMNSPEYIARHLKVYKNENES